MKNTCGADDLSHRSDSNHLGSLPLDVFTWIAIFFFVET
jgi:hypothetical protein